mmetsp:Transcript_75378/g.245160  ORF Transcript_75378/g.245160 Transcript_75378/m.245160 type:complete len:307 (-) Transcript_75378:522-1442(-)
MLFMQWRSLGAPRGLCGPVGVVALVHLAERLHDAGAPVRGRGLVWLQPCGQHGGNVDVGVAIDDILGDHTADATTSEDTDRVHASGNVIVLQLRGLSHDRREIGSERLRATEELLRANLEAARHSPHSCLQKRRHAVPIRIYLTERKVVRHRGNRPRRSHRLEKPDHQPATLRPDICVPGGVLHDRPSRIHVCHGLRQKVIMLCSLIRNGHPGQLAQLSCPHPRGIDEKLTFHIASRGLHTRHLALRCSHARNRDAFHHGHSAIFCAAHESSSRIDRVDTTVILDIKASQHVVRPTEREHVLHLSR